MRWLLFLLTIVEVALVVTVLVVYLVAIIRSLRRTAEKLGKVTFGVRAIEVQTRSVGPSLRSLNETLERFGHTVTGGSR